MNLHIATRGTHVTKNVYRTNILSAYKMVQKYQMDNIIKTWQNYIRYFFLIKNEKYICDMI